MPHAGHRLLWGTFASHPTAMHGDNITITMSRAPVLEILNRHWLHCMVTVVYWRQTIISVHSAHASEQLQLSAFRLHATLIVFSPVIAVSTTRFHHKTGDEWQRAHSVTMQNKSRLLSASCYKSQPHLRCGCCCCCIRRHAHQQPACWLHSSSQFWRSF